MNLCTDQLALLLAAPGQLISVSYLAADPNLSLLSEETQGLVINHGLGEEIFRLESDLVLAGRYTTRATINLLKRLGKPVAEFDPANGFDDIARNVRRMGTLLGSPSKADRLIAGLEAALTDPHAIALDQDAPVLGSYGANSYTTGAGTLENDIVTRSGFRHLGEEIGVSGTTRLPLEALILADPEVLLVWNRAGSGPSRSTEVLAHPALARRFADRRRISDDSRYWICGTPFSIEAVRRLREQLRQWDTSHGR